MKILLIEDDDALRMSLTQTLDLEGFEIIQAGSFAQARRTIRSNFSGVILSDIRMPGKDGFEVLSHARSVDADLPVIFLTGEGDVPMAMRALRSGAYDFLEKPCETKSLVETIKRGIEKRQLVLKNRKIERALVRNDVAAINFPGSSDAIKKLRKTLRETAQKKGHVFIFGERGSGRRLAAHTLYVLSGSEGPYNAMGFEVGEKNDFDRINIKEKAGFLSIRHFENADNDHQQQLVKLIEENPNLRVSVSSNCAFDELVADGLNPKLASWFKEAQLLVPSLVARKEDLPELFESLVRQSARSLNVTMPEIPQAIYAQIVAHDWAGNINELRGFANSFCLGLNVHSTGGINLGLSEQMDLFEKLILTETLRKHKGIATECANALKLPRKTLYDRLNRYKLRPKDFQ